MNHIRHSAVLATRSYQRLLLLAAALLFCAGLAAAQTFPRTLEDIKVYDGGETIDFLFSQPFAGQPELEHRPGQFEITFPSTGSTQPVRQFRPAADGPYQDIRVVQNRFSTTVTFTLKDGRLSLQNRVTLKPQGELLQVAVAMPKVAVVDPADQLLAEAERRIGGLPATSQTAGSAADPLVQGAGMGGDQFWISLLTMAVGLIVIVMALYLVLWVYNRYFRSRLGLGGGAYAMKQVAAFHIGPRQRVVVLEINGEVIACGVTPQQITYLTTLGGKPAASKPRTGAATPQTKPAPAAPAARAPGDTREAERAIMTPPPTQAARPAADYKEDPVHQFADVLKQKVRSLKRIN